MFNFQSLKAAFDKDKKILLNNAWDFFLFMVISIVGTLIFYTQTGDEFTSAFVLFILWLFFWKESDLRGKVFLVLASVIGFVHELIGVKIGYFTYLNGVIGGVPLWVIPGYGAIFWASYNLWKVFEQKYSEHKWFSYVNYFILFFIFAMFIIDYFFLDLALKPFLILFEFAFAFLIFKTANMMRLAFFVGLFTVFDEIAGEILGAWSHSSFSLFSLMSGYVFLLWICLTVTDLIKGTKKWSYLEVLAMIILLSFFGFDVMLKFVQLFY
ncbi:MAG: hypothetical protein K0B02_02815 [DPANN group archaeon]|nr:hypothetical protein [DPANN group archaeon]